MEQLSKRYRLLSLLGQGGMAKVYKAEDEVLGRTVAVKLLREQYVSDQAFVGRFLQEARSAASLSHPNIVNVFDVGDDDGTYYIVMEYVDGVSLKDLIQQEAPFSLERAIRIASQICAGLQVAHRHQLVHRDIKPQNVLVTHDGHVKIADFGIARALGEASFSETGQILGSVHYLSPEQAQGKQATPASDIYALGVVCYEMLTGKLPFEGETVVGVALRHIQEAPRPLHELNPAIPPTMESIVLRALAKDPTERYPSAKEMGQALHEYEQLGEQSTGVVQAIKIQSSPVASANTTRVAPVAIDGPVEGAQRSRSGGNFLLLFLAVLALVSVLGLCALGNSLYQTYNEKFANNRSPIGLFNTAPSPTTGALVPVPNVEGKEAAEARSAIESNGLLYTEGPPEFNDTIPAGRVVRQSIQPGTPVNRGLEVKVVLSKGRDDLVIEFVIGYGFDQARDKLEAKGFKVVRQDQTNAAVAPGVVYDQRPKANERAPRGTTVTLFVSRGNKVVVPNVVGKTETDAKKIIADAGLRNGMWVNPQGHADLPASLYKALEAVPIGGVVSTRPSAGTEVDPGTEVTLAVRKD